MFAVLADATCSDEAWAMDYSPERCHMVGDTAVAGCTGKISGSCGMRMYSRSKVGRGVYSMAIKAAPGAGVATAFYLSTSTTNGGLFTGTPWVEIDWEILGLQAGPQTRIWTNLMTGVAQEHNELVTVPFDVSAGYHTYSIHISNSTISWVADGVAYRTIDFTPFPDVVEHVGNSDFKVFASLWGRSERDPVIGIPAFRDALGVLENNSNHFPLYACYRRGGSRRLGGHGPLGEGGDLAEVEREEKAMEDEDPRSSRGAE